MKNNSETKEERESRKAQHMAQLSRHGKGLETEKYVAASDKKFEDANPLPNQKWRIGKPCGCGCKGFNKYCDTHFCGDECVKYNNVDGSYNDFSPQATEKDHINQEGKMVSPYSWEEEFDRNFTDEEHEDLVQWETRKDDLKSFISKTVEEAKREERISILQWELQYPRNRAAEMIRKAVDKGRQEERQRVIGMIENLKCSNCKDSKVMYYFVCHNGNGCDPDDCYRAIKCPACETVENLLANLKSNDQ